MTAISGAFFSQFPATGELGVSLTSIAGGTGNDANAASIISAGTPDTSNPFTILSANSATTSTSPTINALSSGELSTEDHTVIASIGETPGNSLLIPFNANGTVPTTIANLQSLNWIKLDTVQTSAGSKDPTGGTFSLTAIGQAIFKRTVATVLGQGTQSTIANAAAANPATASAIDSTLSSQVSTLVSALSSVGVDVNV
jgi:hypothetical protein